MEKTVYETYGYVETNSEGQFIEPSQFFVVQNDGTLIINKQAQLMSEMPDVKHLMDGSQTGQPCPVYHNHMSQQPEYLISNTDFILPDSQDGPCSDNYANRVLLQQTQGHSADQIQPHLIVDHLKSFATNEIMKTELDQIPPPVSGPITDNIENSCTEITLNDEQWRMMQKKGWLLLEISDKIFLLDTLGLHDITENDELIQKLRSENVTSNFIANNETEMPTVNLNETGLQIDTPMFPCDTHDEQSQDNIVEKGENMVGDGRQQVAETKEQVKSEYSDSKVDLFNTPATENYPNSKFNDQNSGTVVRLITNYSLKDIPQKMVLGKTASGKNLIAKVVSVKKKPIMNENPMITPSSPNPPSSGATQNTTETSTISQFENVSKHELGKVDGIVGEFLSQTKQTLCSREDVHAAEAVITQLLNVPTTRQPLLGRNLILTKIVKTMSKSEVMLLESKPTLVPGRVIQSKNTQDEWNFEYIPNLLHTIIKGSGPINNTNPSEMQPNNKSKSDYILHIHVVEIKRPNSPLKTSITFSRRSISRLRQLTVHACSACANVFQNVLELKHHKNQCPSNSNRQTENLTVQELTMDEESDGRAGVSVGEKRKLFDCSTCPAKNMNKMCYSRHLKSHFGPTDPPLKKPLPTNGSTNLFQCKMCLVSFYHSATLSKHIKSQHLQSKSDVLV